MTDRHLTGELRKQPEAVAVGMPVDVLELPLSHRTINESLGLDNGDTRAVEAFMQCLGVLP